MDIIFSILSIFLFLFFGLYIYSYFFKSKKDDFNLIKCKDCGHAISKNAKSCPNCGKVTNKSSFIFNTFLTLSIIFVLMLLIGKFSSKDEKSTTSYSNYKTSNYSAVTPQKRFLFATDFALKVERMGIEVYLDDTDKEYIRLKSALFYNKEFRDELLTNSFKNTLEELEFKKLTFDTGTEQYEHYLY